MTPKVRMLLLLVGAHALVKPSRSLAVRGGGPEPISEEEVAAAVKSWCDGVVEIGKVYSEGGDYKAKAAAFLATAYGYDLDLGANVVLFKPTKVSEVAFRPTFEGALSYFAATGVFPEDKGFAIQPWSKVRFEISGMFITGDQATAMGHYWFTDASTGAEAKVEFTFAYVRGPGGKLRTILHHSSLPYAPH